MTYKYPRHTGVTARILRALYDVGGPMTPHELAHASDVGIRTIWRTLPEYEIRIVNGLCTLPQYLVEYFKAKEETKKPVRVYVDRFRPARQPVRRPVKRHASAMGWFVGTSV